MVTKLAHVERERAILMLTANVTPLVVAKRFRCHVRTIGRLKNRFPRNWDNVTPSASRASTCVDARSRSRHADVSFVQSILSGVSHSQDIQGTHNPKIGTQTVRNRFKRFV